MRTNVVAALAAVLLVVLSATVPLAAGAAGDDVGVLLDRGDGRTEWTEAGGHSVEDVLDDAAASLGISLVTDGGRIEVDGVSSRVTGSSGSGGSFTEPGATGVTAEASWHVFGWSGGWVEVDDISAANTYGDLALAFYPDGIVPVETPDEPYAWTMSRGDSANTGAQTGGVQVSDSGYDYAWSDSGTAHATMLYAGGYVFQKYGVDRNNMARLVCLDADTGEHVWEFEFSSAANYESSTPLIVGDYIYVATMTGYIYKMPWLTGPGDDYENVVSFGGSSFNDAVRVPTVISEDLTGTTYDSGFSSMVLYSGAIYVAHSNGMVYCLDLDLNLIWSYMCGGQNYLVAPTVYDGYVFNGSLDGHLYILDAATGAGMIDETVYQVDYRGKTYGGVGQIAVSKNDAGVYTLIFTVSDGLGMSQINSGLAVYNYNPSGNTIVKVYLDDGLGVMGRYVTPVSAGGFDGAYLVISDGLTTGLYRISTQGVLEKVRGDLAEIHAPIVLLNGQYLVMVSYSPSDPVYMVSLDGEILGVFQCSPEVRNFNMTPVVIIGDRVFAGTDSGIYALTGTMAPYSAPTNNQGQPIIMVIAEVLVAIAAILAVIYAALRFGKGVEKPFAYLKHRFLHYLYGEDYSHNTRNRHRLRFVIAIGAVLTFAAFTLCLCVGSTSINNPIEAYSALFSAISKGGVGLDTLETSIYVSRLPRTIAALAVGIGLSVAGCIYQAVIRNPLVDPYIMGVSSGAGVAAIAVIAFDFTFFGMFSSHSIFLTAITACIGGLIAFGCTMLLAERAGGSAVNYVLAGVVVGLAFSAVQTIMLTMAGNKLSNALTWLYGSFAEITWTQVGIILFLSVFLSLVPLLWAKELNLVLLGEDQARQMGLNVRRFNRGMLVLASILTSVCVAFVGVIGFVGLVIPHLCRMLLGSDHRMVLPASICFGGVMLMLADLLARTGYYGMELPVGAITTVIGIPVFAYLLIKRGRMYDG